MKKIIFSFFFFQCENEKTFQKKKKLLMLKIRQKTPLLGEEAKPGNKRQLKESRRARRRDDALSAKHARHDRGDDEFWSRAWIQRRARRAGARRTPFFFLLFSLFDHALARGLTRRLRILTTISSLSLFLSIRNQTGATSRDETLANASVRERVRDFNRRRDVFETVGARFRGTGFCGGG